MTGFTAIFNKLSSIGAIIMAASAVYIFLLLLIQKNKPSKVLSWINTHFLLLGFLVTLVAMLGSLVYSDIIGYPPCLFCWYARILLYPQVLLYGIASYKKDSSVTQYTFPLTLIGLCLAVYHYITESIQYSPLPCSAGGVSCLTRYVYEWGFVTIPFMVLATLLLLTALLCVKKYGFLKNLTDATPPRS